MKEITEFNYLCFVVHSDASYLENILDKKRKIIQHNKKHDKYDQVTKNIQSSEWLEIP